MADLTNTQLQEDDEIDLLELANVLLAHWLMIALCAIIGCAAFFGYSKLMIAPTYQSTAKLYVVAASSDSVVDLTDLNIGTSLKSDYQDLMMSYPVLDQVIKELDLEIDDLHLAKMISVTNPQDTRVLYITATTTSPELSRDIANTMAEVAIKYLPETMSTEAPNIAQTARLNPQKVAPSNTKNGMIGGILGIVISCGFLVIRYLLDDTIHTQDDLEKEFGLVPLAVIPEYESLVDRADVKKHHRSKKKGKGKK